MTGIKLDQESEYNVARSPYMAEKIIFVDGQEGCGKTLFSCLVSAFDRVEKLTYAYEIEWICSLYHLRKIEIDAAVGMVRMLTDLTLYDTMMSREVNFRPSDLSSVFRDGNTFRYLKRLFMEGDMAVPARIKRERPILSLTVHKMLSVAQPVLEALRERAVFVEIVRHPLYMIIQQSLNNQILIRDARDFVIYFEQNNKEYPWYTAGWESLFENSNPVEKTIYYMQKIGQMVDRSKEELIERYGTKILTIPFEGFVIDPWPYMTKMEELFGSKITNTTRREMKRQNVPRKKISDGIPLAVYKRCGWEPPRPGASEENEFEIRRQFAAKTASPEAMKVLHQLCADYEERYMGRRIIKGDHYE